MAKTSEIVGWTALAGAGITFVFAGAYSLGVALDGPDGPKTPPYRRAADLTDRVDDSAFARSLGAPQPPKTAEAPLMTAPPPSPRYAPLIATPGAWEPPPPRAVASAKSALPAPPSATPSSQVAAAPVVKPVPSPAPVSVVPPTEPPSTSAPAQTQPQTQPQPQIQTQPAPPLPPPPPRSPRAAALVIAALPPPASIKPPPAPADHAALSDLSGPPPELAPKPVTTSVPAGTPSAKPEPPPSVVRAPTAPPPPRGGVAASRAELDLPPAAPAVGIVISVAERRLYHLRGDGQVDSYPVAVGKTPSVIPLGATQIIRKRRDPTWIPTPDMRRKKPNLPASVPPGPNNPMGRYAMDLGWSMYRIHGTNQPDSIGRAASSGCFRMLPKDVEQLFSAVEVGERVFVASGRLRKAGTAAPSVSSAPSSTASVPAVKPTPQPAPTVDAAAPSVPPPAPAPVAKPAPEPPQRVEDAPSRA